jgi:hypothetical protein
MFKLSWGNFFRDPYFHIAKIQGSAEHHLGTIGSLYISSTSDKDYIGHYHELLFTWW